ncbi:hypothetical protein Vafri_15446 [Volvox africanus]|uniref:Uncharacterized protein n=1 Tax=Volvox africanus TaxID=51714 RepID=A0A8J4BGG7_9CHLO|nr:hypothetical protein Vafri_15446 [Volvox africanus]
MDVVPGGMAPGNFVGSADQVQLHARTAGSRNRPLSNGFPYVMRIPSTSSGEVRLGFSADVTTGISLTGPGLMPAPAELLSSRPAFTDCLSSIGLPGEESATFIPLIIEPYEPAVSTAPATSEEPDVPALTTITETASVELPPSPLTPPTAPTQPSNSPELSPMSTPAGKAARSTAMSTSPTIMPRPPPGSAVQRVNSCRRNLVRQTSNANSVVTAAAAGGGGGSTPALPPAPKTPLPAMSADVPILILPPPSPVSYIGETPAMGIESAAAPSVIGVAVPGGSGGGGGNFTDSNKATSSFLDPSKPAVRRLLPPLLRASQAFQDSTTAIDALPAAADDGGGIAAGCSPAPLTSRCSSSFNVGGSNMASPAGGVGASTAGALEVWAELQEASAAAAATMTAAESVPLSPPPPLPVDVYDLPSPRGRRALPPMDPLRTSALSATSTSEAISELDSAPEDRTTTTTQPELHSMASPPRPLDVSFALQAGTASVGGVRRSGTQRLPWESEGPRMWGVTASETGETAPAGGGAGGDVCMMPKQHRGPLVQRTPSFHAVGISVSGGGVSGGGAGASGGGACGGGGPLPLDMPRLRTWSAITPEVPLTSLSSGGGGFSGCASSANGGAGAGAGAGGGPSPKERCRLNHSNSMGFSTPRMPVAVAAAVTVAVTATPTAPLPPIADRGGNDRRQTSTC